jgi:hypothetical protein
MKVFTYKNLHLDCYSVREESTRRVGWHGEHVLIRDVTFKVSEAGRQRVLREKRKNVHAGVKGQLVSVDNETIDPDGYPVDYDTLLDESWWACVRYNPYKGPHFVADGRPVIHATEALLTPSGVFARGLTKIEKKSRQVG